MEQQCGRKIELRLNEEQKKICFRSCAAARRAYNWKLAAQNADYELAKRNTPEGQKVKCTLGSPIDWHREATIDDIVEYFSGKGNWNHKPVDESVKFRRGGRRFIKFEDTI